MASIGTSAWLPGSWRDAHSCANSSEVGKSLAVQVLTPLVLTGNVPQGSVLGLLTVYSV